ncbi:MAG: hypothetical protein BYD32DRAFT_429881 [Podila humilis]|nr:MAG: hypothetical protein BYD32DRAFT_429881 [Podila humilis]
MDTLQPLEEIDLSFPAQPSSSSTFIHSHNNVMASSHKSTDAPMEKEEEGVKTEPQEETPERQRFVAVVIPAKRPSSSSSDDENTMRVKAELAEAVVKKEEQEDDEYMESEDEEASLASSSRPGFHAASSATNTIVKPYNARVEGQKSRAYFSEKTNVMLENIYASNPYPNKDLKAELAEKIKITEGQVSNWFSRRRKRAADEALEKKQHQEMLERLGGPKLSSLPQASSTPVSITTSALALSARSSPSPSVESPGTPITLINGALKRSRHESEQDPKQKLRSMEVSKKLSFLLRGGAIVNPNDVDEINDLMEQTGNDDGKKYILNALLSTKSPTVQERFLNSSGLGILRSWIIDARKSPRETHNADLLLKSMLVLKSLPFTVSKLFECKLGKSVKLLARDNEIGPGKEQRNTNR